MYTKKSVDQGNKLYDCWDLWINPYIKKESRQLIRREMKRPLTKTDKPGYIYAYSFENGPLASTDAFAYFKIGRTADPHRRMYQVAHLCNHMPKIIELFPSFPLVTDRPYMSTNLETLDRKIQQLPKCPATHRVERLILLELSSLYEKADVKCSACGQLHREWIRVERTRYADGTLMTDQELWTSNIKPVVLRWIQYGVLASAINKENFIYK
ncbi:hypothetical protein CU098_009387 [Rhizopus stolonifer]|uniref:Bacteriophage T5 Orf172 DNA-binding domain-containing protein n=1 Tax=Rhizopus stolonifer TaxID=4846 RepID=A0A367J745_RHIST|nr:hypothetical protein CU098_009387 [Rhizopus stolonifer]